MCRQEWQEQKQLARLLDRWLDPSPASGARSSALAGAIRKARGVKPRVPDVLIWYHGKTVAIEPKSR